MPVSDTKIAIVQCGQVDSKFAGAAAYALKKTGISLVQSGDDISTVSDVLGTILLVQSIDKATLDKVRRLSVGSRVVALAQPTGQLRLDAARSLIKAGAVDAFEWDSGVSGLDWLIHRFERWREIDELLDSRYVRARVIGKSEVWRKFLSRTIEAARYTTDAVLLTGESGTGKELIARLIHDLDGRPSKGQYVILDCTTIVPELSGSEFFGHERGAFTGAHTSRDGAFALADGGTLFLDEIGDLPLVLQAQLLRVVQEGTFRRVGSNKWRRTDFRLICATNRDLQQAVREGTFRRDLLYRITSWNFELPALRDRREDIPALARHFSTNAKRPRPIELDPLLESHLRRREYPGNVRELKQLMNRLANLEDMPPIITLGCLPPEEWELESSYLARWPDESFQVSIRQALGQGLGMSEILEAATEMTARISVADEMLDSEGNGSPRAEVLRRAARKLGRTKRSLEEYDKRYGLISRVNDGVDSKAE